MPSRSAKQRRKMAVLYKQGKISKTQWGHFKKVVPSGRKKSKKRKGKKR
jgi:hypothetical protein